MSKDGGDGIPKDEEVTTPSPLPSSIPTTRPSSSSPIRRLFVGLVILCTIFIIQSQRDFQFYGAIVSFDLEASEIIPKNQNNPQLRKENLSAAAAKESRLRSTNNKNSTKTSSRPFLYSLLNDSDYDYSIPIWDTDPALKVSKYQYQPHNLFENVPDFEPIEGVVIVTKIHGSASREIDALQQMVCLLHYAYNFRVNYPMVVFHSVSLGDTAIQRIRLAVPDGSLQISFHQDNPGLHEMVHNFTSKQRETVLENCGVHRVEELHWTTACQDETTRNALKYNWQAEFRAKHLYRHPALQDYHTMVWADSDAFPTHVWEKDPIAFFLRHSLVLLFDHFPMGRSYGVGWKERFQTVFGRSVCRISMVNGTLVPQLPDWKGSINSTRCPHSIRVPQVHGFFHISNLDWYRSPQVLYWSDRLIGDELRFSRRYDDQIGITVPAAVWASNFSWELEANGFVLDIFHNSRLDGKVWANSSFHTNYWPTHGNRTFPELMANAM